MLRVKLPITVMIGVMLFTACSAVVTNQPKVTSWSPVETSGHFSARHEAGFVAYASKGFLIGGRGIKPVDVLEPHSLYWSSLAASPLELHHFQPVVYQDEIVIAGAMTGQYPNEKPVKHIYYFYPDKNRWEVGPAIPENRLRGSTISLVHNGALYMVGGITDGHNGGNVNWVDRFDFASGEWTQLADAPHARDHAQGVLLNNKIYALAGRRTQGKNNKVFALVEPQVDVFDLATLSWSTLAQPLPIPRAGIASFAYGNSIIVVGGESADPSKAHEEVHRYDTVRKQWSVEAPLDHGRHGSGVILIDDYLWIASGSGKQGGSPELKTTERILLKDIFN